MDRRNVSLSTTLFLEIGLVGCQTVKSDQMLSTADGSHNIKQATWKTKGEIFDLPDNSILTSKESRIVFVHELNDNDSNIINIGIGADNEFQTCLQDGSYSDIVICSGSQLINVEKLNKDSKEVLSYSKKYQFIPQTTNYLKVGLSIAGNLVIQQIPANEALLLLNQSTRQTHQISRVLSDCTVENPSAALIQEPIAVSTIKNSVEITSSTQFSVLVDFDSTGIKNNQSIISDSMANFIKSYPKMAVTLGGHTDNKGAERYNLKLSQSRASIVKDILVNHYGIQAIRLSSVGYGESMPIDTNNTGRDRQNNRRVVASYLLTRTTNQVNS
ncbi:OmpA family protein [Psychrobacter sp. PAMC 21119]|uniref:OmpA family protein n=1 Tax=Psychrobacter sp. PAMC 21119 TaxID=1112209 RepID=UPI0002887CAF|nr:OmpA family protein [Psychrobacter sp. PAMC 21119]